MRSIIIILSIVFATQVYGQKVTVLKFEQLDSIINTSNGVTKIINFWATWCGPCIREIPQFQALHEKYKDDNVEVILVTLDFVEKLNTSVKKLVAKKKLSTKLYLLDETDYDNIIDKIDESWSGAIPATLFVDYKRSRRKFIEKEFKEGELEKTLLEFRR